MKEGEKGGREVERVKSYKLIMRRREGWRGKVEGREKRAKIGKERILNKYQKNPRGEDCKTISNTRPNCLCLLLRTCYLLEFGNSSFQNATRPG